ncbi:MAG TPA: hypothetical protein VFS02_22440 [Telluria sp.]|nr:hypothetical protein [Telluria sp.]
MTSLAEALPQQQARVRELAAQYRSIGAAGVPAALMMEASLQAADRAAASGDVIAMIRAHEDLKGYSA